jgi:hypothetical protein
MRKKTPAAFVALALTLLGAHLWSGCGARSHFEGDTTTIAPLARGVADHAIDSASAGLGTGDARFDGEWALVTCQMTLLGLGQVVLESPELRAEMLPGMTACSDRLVDPALRQFGTDAWGEDGLQAPDSHGHAYLGYLALGLSMHRLVDPSMPHADTHDRLIAALSRRLDAANNGLIQTYPGETYPPDVAAVAGAIGLHGRATGTDHSAVLARWSTRFREHVDPHTGLLRQSHSGPGRGSGTAIAAYFTAFADPELSEDLYAALVSCCAGGPLGLGAVLEYPPGVPGRGDVDSGPLILGYSIAATGFAIGGARAHGDLPTYRRLFRTSRVFGLPVQVGGRRHYVTGGGIGNAIMLAMLTAHPLH